MSHKIALEDRFVLNEALSDVLEGLGYSLSDEALNDLTHVVADFVETHEQ